MSSWKDVPDEQSYGIIIYNFNTPDENKLKLNVGESVHLLQEEENWYLGYSLSNQKVKGIFPKTYVKTIECTIDRDGIIPVFLLKRPTIVHEITIVLREWGTHWKRLYVTHDEKFEKMKTQIYELISHRSKILSGTLTVDELKKVTTSVMRVMDLGNKLLGADLILRDKNGNIINSKEISTVNLYQMHKTTSERINKSEEDRKDAPVRTAIYQYSHVFLVSVRNFTVKVQEDAELFIYLYDAKEGRAITESYVVKWSKDGLMRDLDQMYNLRVMFSDLGKRDLEREKIYLVCNVIRNGAMYIKEEAHHRRSSASSATSLKYNTDCMMRRPFGVAAKEITGYLSGTLDCDMEQEYTVPFVPCEKDNLEQTLKKITNKDMQKIESKNQSLFVSFKVLHGAIKQAREENPHLVLGNVAMARKMGFPEVILPGDVRNDLYITILSGEFPKGGKSSDKNVEVTVMVCNEHGKFIPGVISLGSGIENIDQYHSVIYYHEDKPQWHETFKIAISIEEFKTSHIKFLFKHRSSNEYKDKTEKPFAMAYVKLMQDEGTTLKDAKHNLVVYKIDHKKITNELDYINLPSTEEELKINSKRQSGGYNYSTKDNFIIASNICSTKLTQNIRLLGLLNYSSNKENLKECLETFLKVDGEEIVKFLQDILDALFNILMEYPDTNTYDKLVLECLLYIISLISNDYKYQHFEPVLDLYIKEGFSATLAYSKLISVIKELISSAMHSTSTRELLFKTMKSLVYIVKFISRSRMLYVELYEDIDNDEFSKVFKDFLASLVNLMCLPCDGLLREHGFFLKSLPGTISDIIKIFDQKQLSEVLCNLFNNMPPQRLTKQKMMTINEIVHSQLFSNAENRAILLPVFTKQIRNLLELQEEVELCIKVLSDILNLLFHQEYAAHEDIKEIIFTTLRTVIQSHINMDKDNPLSAYLVAVMIDIFRQMQCSHYTAYIKEFKTRTDMLDFLMEILSVFHNLVNHSVFPNDWCEMFLIQNDVILKALKFFSHTIRDYCFEAFDQQAWSNFFHCAIAFMTQPSLQLETFTDNKRMRILKRFNDMRRETGFEIRSMWFNLGTHKVHFVPSLVGPLLEMTLIPEKQLRSATIPIFFDMMQAEYYSSKYEVESFGDTKRDSSHIKGNFCNFENEMILKLDTLIEGGKGDENYRDLFHQIMLDLCSKHTSLKTDGVQFVKMVTKLLERLLEYRHIIHDENKENRMSCTVNLLEYYSEINRQEMYIRYVYKLCDLHLECDDFTEAAYSLQLHTKLLEWSDAQLSPMLASTKLTYCHTHRQLKENLYNEIIDYFSKGKMYECALEVCQELVKQYEEETFDYEQLSKLHNTMAKFYDEIMKNLRPESEYFRVGYYGHGFPSFVQNKVFIYRGKGYEKLADFTARIVNAFPKAELIQTLNEPDESIKLSEKQYIQINKVDPVMDEKTQRFSGKPVSQQIVRYYKTNHIKSFQYSRPFKRKDPKIESDNDFANLWIERTVVEIKQPLPGILRWFPIEHVEVIELSPLRNAIETMENSNKELRNLILEHTRDRNTQLNPLTMKINGIVDPAVMGGTTNYEKVFFTEEYLRYYPDDGVLVQRLKDLIADQIPLLELCLQIHKERVTPDLMPLHKRIEECFIQMQANVCEKYGKRTCDIKLDNRVTMRRHFSNFEPKVEPLDVVGIGGRVSSLTRTQVASFKNFTSSFNFSTNSPQINSKLLHNSTKSLLLSPTRSLTNTPSLSAKKAKSSKTKRRSSKTENMITTPVSISSAQWYTIDDASNNMPIFELTQALTPKRPLRSEIEKEKRLSRPSSGQFSRPNSMNSILKQSNSSGNSSNRDSIETTDSSICDEEIVPPPLPVKLRETDSLSTTNVENNSFLHSNRCSIKSTVFIKLQAPNDDDDNGTTNGILTSPPTPPPKPPKRKT